MSPELRVAPRDLTRTRPDRFRWLAQVVRVERIGAEELVRWKGPLGYFFRAKFEAVRRAVSPGPCHLMLVDADTLVTRPLLPLIAALERGACVMHAPEKAVGARKGTREALRQVFGQRFADTSISAATMVFNSGVVGIPAGRQDLVERALRCNDALLEAGVRHFAVEAGGTGAWPAFSGFRTLNRSARSSTGAASSRNHCCPHS